MDAPTKGGRSELNTVLVERVVFPQQRMKTSFQSPRKMRGLKFYTQILIQIMQDEGSCAQSELSDKIILEMLRNSVPVQNDASFKRRICDCVAILVATNILERNERILKWKGIPLESDPVPQSKQLVKQSKAIYDATEASKNRIHSKRTKLSQISSKLSLHKWIISRNAENDTLNLSRLEFPFILAVSKPSNEIKARLNSSGALLEMTFSDQFEIRDNLSILDQVYNLVSK